MTRVVPVVDLFAGPGGLAEGFSACRRLDGRRRYRIALSIEKDPVAHRTLRLRAFLRKFATGFPPEYYDFLNGVVPEEPDWAKLYPGRWAPACEERFDGDRIPIAERAALHAEHEAESSRRASAGLRSEAGLRAFVPVLQLERLESRSELVAGPVPVRGARRRYVPASSRAAAKSRPALPPHSVQSL